MKIDMHTHCRPASLCAHHQPEQLPEMFLKMAIDDQFMLGDYLRNESICVGFNDVSHEIYYNNGVDTDKFEKIYTMLIDEVKAACPETKIIIMAPYALEGEITQNAQEMPDRLETFKKGVAEKAEVARKISEKYGLPLIQLQPAFDEACTKAPSEYWCMDGVHPTACGHEIIKRLWIETFQKIR